MPFVKHFVRLFTPTQLDDHLGDMAPTYFVAVACGAQTWSKGK